MKSNYVCIGHILRIVFEIIMMALLLSSYAEAITLEWNKTFGGINDDRAHSVEQTSDSGYILAGETNGSAWLIKTDANGNEKWNRTFGGTYSSSASSVAQTSDGGYIIAGSLGCSLATSHAWLIKTDVNGNLKWNKVFQDYCPAPGTGGDTAKFVQQTSDGGYIISGYRIVYTPCIGSCWPYGEDFLFIKTDVNGNEQWNKTFGSESDDIANSVEQTSDGGYIIAGTSSSSFESAAYIIKMDEKGNQQWTKTFGTGTYVEAKSIKQTLDGGFIIAGYTHWQSAADAWLIKIDSKGNETWNKTYVGHAVYGTSSVSQTSDGGYILTGETYAGYYDAWILKTDANGNQQWNKTFGGTNYDIGESIQQTTDGGFIIAGYTGSYGAGSSDAWLVKLREDSANITPPASITNLKNRSYAANYINWTWTDPADYDFSKVMVYISGIFKTNVTKGIKYYNATGLIPNTSYTISTHTVDTSGNINKTWVNHTARTAKDTVPPTSITNLKNSSYTQNSIKWIWIDPKDSDFTRVMVYLDGKFKANISKGVQYYNTTGLLPYTVHTISTRTVDTSGNINKTWRNHTARTKPDAVSPRSVTNLINRSYAPTYINWAWTDPTDYDFAKVMVYINGIFKTNVIKGIKYYNATGLIPNTLYRISTHTVDTSSNINKTWVNHTARTAKDKIPPASVTNLKNVTYKRTYINWTWKDPSTYDFAKVMVYLNGVFKGDVTKGKQYYNATGLKNNTYYKISTHTVDTSGNVNKTWVNHTARTAP